MPAAAGRCRCRGRGPAAVPGRGGRSPGRCPLAEQALGRERGFGVPVWLPPSSPRWKDGEWPEPPSPGAAWKREMAGLERAPGGRHSGSAAPGARQGWRLAAVGHRPGRPGSATAASLPHPEGPLGTGCTPAARGAPQCSERLPQLPGAGAEALPPEGKSLGRPRRVAEGCVPAMGSCGAAGAQVGPRVPAMYGHAGLPVPGVLLPTRPAGPGAIDAAIGPWCCRAKSRWQVCARLAGLGDQAGAVGRCGACRPRGKVPQAQRSPP